MKGKIIGRVVCFLLCFAILFGIVSTALIQKDSTNYQNITSFYDQRENSLDAVYIGSSACFAFWNPVVAWENYGITVYSYACNKLLFNCAEYLIKETRKTQPNATFIINLNTFSEDEVDISEIYNLINYMPFSKTKLELINYLCEFGGYSYPDNVEFYFPFIRFHSALENLLPYRLFYKKNGLKGACIEDSYLYGNTDCSELYNMSTKVGNVSDKLIETTNSLLDYCDKENVKVIFVTVPQAKDIEFIEKCNKLNELIESRGYPVVNLINSYEELGIDLKNDFYDDHHTNIHGSIKYTNYLSQYLVENYGFEDKRNNPEYEDWNQAVKEYEAYLTPHILDIERDISHRDFNIPAPSNIRVTTDGVSHKITWNVVEGVNGYVIYGREKNNNGWKVVTTVEKNEYLDTDADSKGKYIVVPYRVDGNEKYYGNFVYLASSAEE